MSVLHKNTLLHERVHYFSLTLPLTPSLHPSTNTGGGVEVECIPVPPEHLSKLGHQRRTACRFPVGCLDGCRDTHPHCRRLCVVFNLHHAAVLTPQLVWHLLPYDSAELCGYGEHV